jgi:serine protease inhibitor
MKALGLTDALDPGTADFTPLREEGENLFISSAEHAATVEIDENGVTGAAYTMMAYGEGALLVEEEIDFVLDRPFLFVVTGMDGSVLFSGIVRNIE